jgi:4-amino-4-deoxy-L-arabinose transferase-like glycosyltransferase
MRGALLWPTFLVLTPIEGILLSTLPPYDGAPQGVIGGVLLAGFANLFLVAVVAPLVGLGLRRRRPDLPRLIATDLCGTALLLALAVGVVAAGLAHRPAAAAQERDLASAYAAVHDYVLARAPEYRPGLTAVDALRLREDAYRVCVPGRATDRWLCLLVDTDLQPVALRRDASMEPNSALRTVGGFH